MAESKEPEVQRGGQSISETGPAKSLEAVVEDERNPVKRFLKILGPGLVTGASDDDPSGIGTYSAAGASLGYSILWMAPVTFPLMAAIQFVCAKVGLVTGMGLTRVLRKHYSKALLYPVLAGLVIANTINAGVDIGAIAAGVNLLAPVPVMAVIILATVAILVVQIWGSYRRIATTFKWLTLALFAYMGAAFYARPSWTEVLHGTLVPSLSSDANYLTNIVAMLGTTISPYLFFWQAEQEVEEEMSMGRRTIASRQGASAKELKYAGWDVIVGMLFSNVVMYFIVLATAATLFKAGKTDVQTAAQAAEALRPLAGNAAPALLALGLIGSGFLAVPILTGSAAYAVAEALGWKRGLDQKPRHARLFYIVIAASTLVGMLINVFGINSIKALFWTAVINGFLAPPLLVVIIIIANNKTIMSDRVNGFWTNVLCGITAAIMFVAAIALGLIWLNPE